MNIHMASPLRLDSLNLAGKAEAPSAHADVVIVYQRMLPYHKARFRALTAAFAEEGTRCVALEVTRFDRSYGLLSSTGEDDDLAESIITLFPDADYLDLTPAQVSRAISRGLATLHPATVFSPAPAFAEGAGALHHKIVHGGRLILMDDAWGATDRGGWLKRAVKRSFHGYVDGGFFPSPLHGEYFANLSIPIERQRWGVDAVGAAHGTAHGDTLRSVIRPYFLYVGRLIRRKGLAVVLRALAETSSDSPDLVVIGDGNDGESLQKLAADLGLRERVHWLGRCSNSVARGWMRGAVSLLIPSDFEQWALVVNEAWIEGIPILGSETIGALRASCPPDLAWTMLRVGDVAGWAAAMQRMAALDPNERQHLVDVGSKLVLNHSLQRHVTSAMDLARLPLRPRPSPLIGLAARLWRGHVAVW